MRPIILLRVLTLLVTLAAILTASIGTTALVHDSGFSHLLALPLTGGVGFLLIVAAWSPPRLRRWRTRTRAGLIRRLVPEGNAPASPAR